MNKNRHIEIKRSGLKGHHLLAQGNALEQINLSCRTRRLYLHLHPHGACFSMPIRFIRTIRVCKKTNTNISNLPNVSHPLLCGRNAAPPIFVRFVFA